jgi:hypothetical protein
MQKKKRGRPKGSSNKSKVDQFGGIEGESQETYFIVCVQDRANFSEAWQFMQRRRKVMLYDFLKWIKSKNYA